MKYLIVQLCESSVSFCNYRSADKRSLIPIDILREGLIWAVKNGLNIQILYPEYELPGEYLELINKFEHIDIKPFLKSVDSEIIVLKDFKSTGLDSCEAPIIIQLTISEFLAYYKDVAELLTKAPRINICFTDIHNFKDEQEAEYENALKYLAHKIEVLLINGISVQCNLLTDRIMLDKMNNCNAGVESITLAPDGKFYICPSFYLSRSIDCGNPKEGVSISNSHLYKIEYAPICRLCDAFHCKRCVWENRYLTNEVNTPGHQQCVMSHIERSVSRQLLESIRKQGEYAPEVSIVQLDYNDPFDKIINNK